MFDLLNNFVPPRAATALLGAWYALLILGILLFGATPETTMRYMNL